MKDTDILISEIQVSREHTVIFSQDSSVFIVDQGTREGTYLNGKRIAAKEKLKSGDVIGVGNSTITFHSI